MLSIRTLISKRVDKGELRVMLFMLGSRLVLKALALILEPRLQKVLPERVLRIILTGKLLRKKMEFINFRVILERGLKNRLSKLNKKTLIQLWN